MVLKDIAKGGAHEVDGIAYIGVINDYQCAGIAKVLTGQVNATGALPDTYVADNASIPAVMNFGGGYYADYDIVARGDDPRYPGVEIGNETAGSFGGSNTYNGGHFIVEAEGIYVGYKYYETRYYDSIMNPGSRANSGKGATQGSAWDYSAEVLYSFGHGLSYLDYTQTLKSVEVDKAPGGNVTAVVELKSNSNQDGYFLAQLYVQQPYTDYDRQNGVEKSAVMFLNSAKTQVKAGGTAEVTITVPSKYLASYDYKSAKTYILDAGDYLFTAAPGAHAAVNNFLDHQGKTAADGMDAEANGAVLTWNVGALDAETFSVENGVKVTNAAETADLSYWTGTDTVTYLSRQDWEGAYPINYNTDVEIRLADSPKKDAWIAELRSETYTIQNNSPAAEGGADAVWPYISPAAVENDSALVEQARQNLKYQLYTYANSAIMNVSTVRVDTWRDAALRSAQYISGGLCAATAAELAQGALQIAAPVLLTLCLASLAAARAEGLGFIYLSNADVILEVQTPANLTSAAGAIANMVRLGAAAVIGIAGAFCTLRKKKK